VTAPRSRGDARWPTASTAPCAPPSAGRRRGDDPRPVSVSLPAVLPLERFSAHVNIPYGTATRLARAGRLPAFKVGGKWFVNEGAARAFLSGGTTNASGGQPE